MVREHTPGTYSFIGQGADSARGHAVSRQQRGIPIFYEHVKITSISGCSPSSTPAPTTSRPRISRLFDREHVPLGICEHCPSKIAYFWRRFGPHSTVVQILPRGSFKK